MYIVLDKDKNIVNSSLTRSDNGFEKNADGDFYKILGDERCITEKEDKKKKEKDKMIEKYNVENKDNRENRQNGKMERFKVLYMAKEAFPLEEIKKSFDFKSVCLEKAKSTYTNVKIKKTLVYPFLKEDKYKKMVINEDLNIIKVWTDKDSGDPDFAIDGAILDEFTQSYLGY